MYAFFACFRFYFLCSLGVGGGVVAFNIKKFFFKQLYLFLAVLGPHGCTGFSPVAVSTGLLFLAVHGLPVAVPSLVVKHRL